MRIKLIKPFAIVKHSYFADLEKAKENALAEIKAMVDSAQKDIVCVVCGKNVYWNYGYWVHGNAGKAYCLDCWRKEGLDKRAPTDKKARAMTAQLASEDTAIKQLSKKGKDNE